jgi:hypothetical protein
MKVGIAHISVAKGGQEECICQIKLNPFFGSKMKNHENRSEALLHAKNQSI